MLPACLNALFLAWLAVVVHALPGFVVVSSNSNYHVGPLADTIPGFATVCLLKRSLAQLVLTFDRVSGFAVVDLLTLRRSLSRLDSSFSSFTWCSG